MDLTPEEITEKTAEYNERNNFWTNQAANQFGFSINFFLTIGIAFMAYLVAIRNKYPAILIEFNYQVDWQFIMYLGAFFLTLVNIVSGIISVITRLYDLRLTRHITWIRKRILKEKQKLLSDNLIDTSGYSRVLYIISNRIKFINGNDIFKFNYKEFNVKFDKLRKHSKLLGELTWKAHKWQIFSILFAGLIYGIVIIF